jgi:hypothetical protein
VGGIGRKKKGRGNRGIVVTNHKRIENVVGRERRPTVLPPRKTRTKTSEKQ